MAPGATRLRACHAMWGLNCLAGSYGYGQKIIVYLMILPAVSCISFRGVSAYAICCTAVPYDPTVLAVFLLPTLFVIVVGGYEYIAFLIAAYAMSHTHIGNTATISCALLCNVRYGHTLCCCTMSGIDILVGHAPPVDMGYAISGTDTRCTAMQYPALTRAVLLCNIRLRHGGWNQHPRFQPNVSYYTIPATDLVVLLLYHATLCASTASSYDMPGTGKAYRAISPQYHAMRCSGLT
eukprot:3007566-Rhodomonas_salina.2